MKTQSFNPDTVERRWFVADLEGQTLGRAASRIASVLRGKHKVQFTPNADCGDFVVVVNAEKVRLTGNKDKGKVYHRHSGYFGGLTSVTAEKMREKDAGQMIFLAVKGMLPKGPLGRRQLKKLKVYTGAEHPHGAQQPAQLDLDSKFIK